ncbi:MAG: carotenoid biosynthesis protein [Mucilaginibacter sp.]|uniref:carotenoid biosynthesis protein n=1 Tax=Mucilaginibacter sp. TaxID=1882438 RepID=UPI003263A3CB
MSKKAVLITIIILFHIVGLIGFLTPALQPLFLKIVPFHLLLMLVLIVYSHQSFNLKFAYFFASLFVFGFVLEWIGVHHHLIFGNYVYGRTLGVRLFDIPLMIGVNWFLLTYATGVLMQHLGFKNLNTRVILGAAVLVLLDILIEPVATQFDYWHWITMPGSLTAPIENYIGWFLAGGLMLGIFEAFKFTRQSMVAVVLLISQFLFFGILNMV